jgi:hypothetical protein
MSTITVDENQLEEIVSKVVQQHLKLTFQDMDEVRKSPAGAIVRLETKIDSLITRAEFKEEWGKLRTDIANYRTESKEELGKLRAESKDTYGNLNARIAKAESKLNLVVTLLFALFGVFTSLLVKLIFFP